MSDITPNHDPIAQDRRIVQEAKALVDSTGLVARMNSTGQWRLHQEIGWLIEHIEENCWEYELNLENREKKAASYNAAEIVAACEMLASAIKCKPSATVKVSRHGEPNED